VLYSGSEVWESAERRELDVLYISPEQFGRVPQVGTPWLTTWPMLCDYFARPSFGEAKDIGGALSPALYIDDTRRKANLVRIWALVVDVDENGDVDAVADAVRLYAAIVHETFSSTDDDPRCRIYLRLAEPIDVLTYEPTHAIVRAHLQARGIVADNGAKDASRVSYVPVRRPGARYRVRVTDGAPLDAARVIAAQPLAPPRSAPRLPALEHADAYRRGALRRAADSIAHATPGERHYAVSREAWSLVRLGLDDHEIQQALLPAAVASMGEARAWEAERTIRDAIRARRGAS
jgi:hypothetical protein